MVSRLAMKPIKHIFHINILLSLFLPSLLQFPNTNNITIRSALALIQTHSTSKQRQSKAHKIKEDKTPNSKKNKSNQNKNKNKKTYCFQKFCVATSLYSSNPHSLAKFFIPNSWP